MSYNTKILTDGCENLGITLSDTQIEQFMIYYEYLIEKNKVMNLTAITEFEDVMIKHFLDSLSIVKAVDMTKAPVMTNGYRPLTEKCVISFSSVLPVKTSGMRHIASALLQ